MKVLPLKKLFLSNGPLKIISLFLGYSFWYSATFHQHIEMTLTVPLCFTTKSDEYILNAPENITITLKGKRSDLYSIDQQSLAAHININKLLPGKHGIILKEHHLFLPNTITLTHCKPSNLSVTLTKKQIL